VEQDNLTVLLGLDIKNTQWPASDSLDELGELARTAGLIVVEKILQSRSFIDPTWYIGKGKLEELKQIIQEKQIKVCIADDELTPSQQKNLEKELCIKVLDRTSLILDIFAKRALTAEAKLQIELAQLEYMLPRLTRLWTHLSRLGGGVGTKGPGETQLETDKRQIKTRMSLLKKKLKDVQKQRELRREKRKGLPVLSAAIIGYTNAGKSTLMNAITNAGVLSENKLFATLDPTTRKCKFPGLSHFIMTDTVGFIQKLPHHLVNAFYATLEELTYADVILHVIDANHSNINGTISTALTIIKELKADHLPMLFVFNKMDLISKPNAFKKMIAHLQPQLCISAAHLNQNEFCNAVSDLLNQFQEIREFHLPYQRMDLVNILHTQSQIQSIEYLESIHIKALIHPILGDKILNALYENETQKT